MSGELDVVVRPLVDFIDREAVKRALHIRCIEISDVVDPDEGSDEGVVRVTVDAPESVVAEFWCSLAEAIESYAQGLPPTKQDLLFERVAVEVDPYVDANSV